MTTENRPSFEPAAPDSLELAAPLPEGPSPHRQIPTTPPSAKRRFGFATLVLVAVVSGALSSLISVVAWRALGPGPDSAEHAAADAPLYQCPMHPTIVQDHPGDCPICGMKLVRLEKGKTGGQPQGASEKKVLFYRSPMDPKQTSPTPRKDEMGMDYLPVYDQEIAQTSAVSGLASIEIDSARQQLIGLKTAEVTEGLVGGIWRTVGRVAVDETRVRRVNLKVPGFVERIYVDYVGKKVKRGDPLFSIYSPELLSTQEEYLLAQKTQSELAKVGGAVDAGEDGLVAGARRKLELWDVSPAAVDKLGKSGKPSKTLTIYSPVAGVVTKKDVVEGMKLDAGAMPYEIVDLSQVWVLVDVYESELRFVKEGMRATLTLSAFPNREFEGKVVFLDPLLEPQTRTVKARLTFPNPTGELRPEMFGEVLLLGSPHRALRVPQDAVIDSGTQKVVFVAVGEGKFEPRAVEVGERDETQVEVTGGLTAGERVVIRGNFLVDSESRLRASLAEVAPASPSKPPESARVLPRPAAPALPSAGVPAGHDGHRP